MTTKITLSNYGDGPAAIWNTIIRRHSMRCRGSYTWKLMTVPPECEDIEGFYQLYMDRRIPQETVRHAYPDHFKAAGWYTANFPASPRWPLEAYLLTGLGTREVAERISPDVPVLAVDIYKRAFFSIREEQRRNVGWMNQYIWSPAFLHRSSLFYYDLVLKVVAFYHGADLLDDLLNMSILSGDRAFKLQEMALDLRNRMALADLNARSMLPAEMRAPLIEASASEWRLANPPQEALNPALTELASTIKKEVSILVPGTETDKEYNFISEKYTD